MAQRTRYRMWIPVAFAAGIFFSCSNDIEEIKALTDDREYPIQTVKGGVFHYTQNGQLSNTLHATELDRFEGEDPRIEVRNGLKLVIYDSLGQQEAVLTADRGTFREIQSKLIARENVVLENRDGESLHTEELIWAQDSDRVYTDKHVKITTQEAVILGKGLVTDSRFSKREIKDVSGTLYIEDPLENDSSNATTQSYPGTPDR